MVLLVSESSRVQENKFARASKSGVDIVSYYSLVLFTRRERSQYSPLINVELKPTWVESTPEGRPEFSIKTI